MKKNYWTAMLVFESRIFQLSRICTMHDISDVIKSYFLHTLLLSSDRSGDNFFCCYLIRTNICFFFRLINLQKNRLLVSEDYFF